MELQDNVAIVTGATGGIGEAIATNLNNAGMKLVAQRFSNPKIKL